MRFAFLGTPPFGAIVLERLIACGMSPVIVITNPDRPVGKKQIITSPPAKNVAIAHNIPVWQPEKLTREAWDEHVYGVSVGLVAAYGKLIPENVLRAVPHGFVGIHPSLLPKYRGPSPLQSMILGGETDIGVTLFVVDALVDHGGIIAQERLTDPRVTRMYYRELHDALALLGATLAVRVLREFVSGVAHAQTQNDAEATVTKKFTTEDGYVAEDVLERATSGTSPQDAALIWQAVRALNPEPGVYTLHGGRRMKIIEADYVAGKLILQTIQYEGGKPKNLVR